MEHLVIYADTADAGLRIDRFLAEECEQLDNLSRSYLQKLIENGNVSVNQSLIKSNYKLKSGDCIVVTVPDITVPAIEAEAIPLDIVYEDEDVIVVNKPKGMVVHPAAGHTCGTLVNALLYHCRENLSGINGELRPGIVHRIDMDTTGLLVACKNNAAHQFLAEQLKVHSITRKYYAICYNPFRKEEGTIDAPIKRSRTDRKKMAVDPDGRRAVTHYKVLRNFAKFSYVECRLETGRTHQIRVHMSSIGHPLLGDSVYCRASAPYRLQGQTLHAGVLGFVHPASREYMEFEAPLPEYFRRLLEVLN